MRHHLFAAALSIFAFLGFLRMPSLDTVILVCPALLVIAISSEEIWEYFHPPSPRSDLDAGPRCPQCRYDLRATPTRCPECGLVLI